MCLWNPQTECPKEERPEQHLRFRDHPLSFLGCLQLGGSTLCTGHNTVGKSQVQGRTPQKLEPPHFFSGKAAEQEAPGSCRPPSTNHTGRPLSATYNSGVCPRLPGGDWRVNCSQAGSSSAPSTAAATHLPTPAPGQAAVHPFLEQLTHVVCEPWGAKGAVPQILRC